MPQERRPDPRRAWWVSAALLVIALGLLAAIGDHPPTGLLAWQTAVPLLALSYAATETWSLPVRHGHETQSYSLAELPLTVGLLLTSPWALVAGRLLGQFAALHFHRRQAAEKIAFNLLLGVVECSAAHLVLTAAIAPEDVLTVAGCYWLLAAVAVVDLVGNAGLTAVISAVEGTPRLDVYWRGFVTGLPPAIASAAFGFIGVRILTLDWLLLGPLSVVTALLLLAFRAHTTLEREHTGLERLAGFTSTLDIDNATMDHVRSLVEQSGSLLDAEIVELTIEGAEEWTHRVGEVPAALDGVTIASVLDPRPERPTVFQARRAAGRMSRLQRSTGLRDAIVVPLPSGTAAGVLIVANRRGELTTFGERELDIAEGAANHLAVAYANAVLAEQLRHSATESQHRARHDDLTGLPNRSALLEHLRARPVTDAFGLMLLDLDRFKEVNDALGHAAGDDLLIQVARRIREALGSHPLIARLGGDEFAIVVDGHEERGIAAGHAIVQRLRMPFELAGVEVEIGASVGIALAPEHGTSTGDLMQRADIAMYKAKQTSTGVELYALDDDQASRRRLDLSSDLRGAIAEEMIGLKFQPIIDVVSNRVTSFEALARWKHPVHGPVPPPEFVTMAEQSGLIRELTLHMTRQAARACRRWQQRGHQIGISVNLSARSLVDQSIPHALLSILREERLRPQDLTIEVTESSLMTDPDRALPIIRDMTDAGMHVAIDDFGTGYSSLAYLSKLDIDVLKIDRSFVWDRRSPRGAAIVRSIIDLGHHLGMSITAEGVEHADDLQWLHDMGCNAAQGYHIARPMDEEELPRFLDHAWLAHEVHAAEETAARSLEVSNSS